MDQSYVYNQGRLEMLNSEISNARVGVRMYKLNLHNDIDWGTTGSIIRATNSSFNNNHIFIICKKLKQIYLFST